jgi:hypothetical protein
VRGDIFCRYTLHQLDYLFIEKILRNETTRCLACGQKGHYLRDCFKKKINSLYEIENKIESLFTLCNIPYEKKGESKSFLNDLKKNIFDVYDFCHMKLKEIF